VRSLSKPLLTCTFRLRRAVLLSGLTVAIGLLSLIVLPVPGLQSVGYGGMLIPLISTSVALTLLPALLGGIGPRVDWQRLRHESRASRAWTTWTSRIINHRAATALVALVALAVLIIPVFSITTGQTAASALAKSGPAHAAYERLTGGGVPSGVLTPIEVLSGSDEAAAVRAQLVSVPGIATADVSHDPGSARAGTTIVLGIPKAETVNSRTLTPVRAARAALTHAPGALGIAGEGAIELDYQHAVFGNFPLMFAVIALLTIALLARAFRSVVLAVKAIALNLVSMAATFGVMTWFWQQGHGSSAVFGISATGAITFWIPLMVFAFLFGLSMDYEVFILTRVREEYDRTGSTDTAIIQGLGRTGRPGHQRRPDPVPVVCLAGLGTEHRRQGASDRPRGRDPARRHDRARDAAAGTGLAARTLELVATPSDRARVARPGGADASRRRNDPNLAGRGNHRRSTTSWSGSNDPLTQAPQADTVSIGARIAVTASL
jgi:putative drug exporter of the RND superfamily